MIAGYVASAFFLLFALQSLPLIIFSPQSFTSYFSMAMLSLLFSLFMRRHLSASPDGANPDGLSGYLPQSLLLTRGDFFATTALLSSIALSLYFSTINPSYLLSLLFCFLQLNAVLFYFFGFTLANGDSARGLYEDARDGISRVTERVQNTVTGQVIQNGYTRMVNGLSSNNNSQQ